jgi:hypothetical protein
VNADLLRAQASVASVIAQCLKDLASHFSRCVDADKLVDQLSVEEREAAREGIEVAMLIKAALDKRAASQVDLGSGSPTVTVFPTGRADLASNATRRA